MKIYCKDCHMYLGEILTGSKIHKRIVFLCDECMKKYETYKSIAEYNKGVHNPSNDMDSVKDLFGGIFKDFNKRS